MGSNETATATTGGPRVIDVFDGNGAPSGPNYLLFSDADRLSGSLWDRSGVGWSPRPHTPVLGALWIENSGDWAAGTRLDMYPTGRAALWGWTNVIRAHHCLAHNPHRRQLGRSVRHRFKSF